MSKVHYTYRVHHRPGSHALVRLNGLPLYDRSPDDLVSPTGPITHALVPGENTLSIVLLDAPAADVPNNLAVILARLEPQAPVDIWSWDYPLSVRVDGVNPPLPITEEYTFIPQGDPPPPVYMEAPEAMFPNEGTPEQHAAVRELYDAFASKDHDRFLDAMSVRMGEFDRAYGPNPAIVKESAQAIHEPWIMEPWNPQELRFERWLDGKVAFVRRLGGKEAIGAVHRDEPFRSWGGNVFITQVGGRWRVFR